MPVRFKRKKGNKYNASKASADGMEFDSTKERDRYLFLKQAEKNGIISNLELQPKYIILPAITDERVKRLKTKDKVESYTVQQPVRYTGDFRYVKDGLIVVEDVKGSKFTMSRDLPLRVKMLRYFHGIQVKLVFNPNEPI
jgi:hypothetical protein